MDLAYKPNWPEARERLLAFWQMEIIDRPCIAVTAPLKPPRPLPDPLDYEALWTDPDHVAQSYDAAHEATYFGGEAMPATSLMVGYCFGYGAPAHYGPETVWLDPIIDDWGTPPSLQVSEDDLAWQRVQAVVRRCAEVSSGRWMTGWPNIHQPNDHLSLLRGTRDLCLDLVDRPDDVKRALQQLRHGYYAMFERISDLLSGQEGSIGWLSLWCPHRRGVTLQSDFSCMLSPAMFEEFIAPEVEDMSEWFGGATYHLDGPGALQHLDRLLTIRGLHAIQWTPGAGQPQGLAWLDLYRRIQERGKGLIVFLGADEVEPALRELKPEGLFIFTAAPSPGEAEAILERATLAV